MRNLLFTISAITVLAMSSELNAQLHRDTNVEPQPKPGFARTVTQLLGDMQGKWSIKSATLKGADLPLDQFESLTVDESGIVLKVQEREARFEFAEFRLDSRTFLARCSSPDYPKGLIYELCVRDGIVTIRYRTNGAHMPPERNADDDQLLVQRWMRAPAK